jgi:hypothetical protein
MMPIAEIPDITLIALCDFLDMRYRLAMYNERFTPCKDKYSKIQTSSYVEKLHNNYLKVS